MFEASLRNGKGQKSQKTPTAGTTTSDENEKRKKAKMEAIVKELRAASVPEEGVQQFVDAWRISVTQRANGKASDWSFTQPDTQQTFRSVNSVVKWLTGQFRGESKDEAESESQPAASSGKAQDGAPGASQASGSKDAGKQPGEAKTCGGSAPEQPPTEGGAAGDEDDPKDAGSKDVRHAAGSSEECRAVLPMVEANKLGAFCLLACFLQAYSKAGALAVGVAAETWASGRRPPPKQPANKPAKQKASAVEITPGPSDKSRARANAAALAAAATGASEPVGSSTASAKKRGLKRKATESPPNGVKEKGKKKDEDSADEIEFDVHKHLMRGMVVLLRSEEDDSEEVGWNKPWSIARVNRVDKGRGTMSLTWLKPVSQQRYWTQKWQPWTVELAGKKKGKRRSGVWTTNNVDIDTVQWGTYLNSNGAFQEKDQEILCREVNRLETTSG